MTHFWAVWGVQHNLVMEGEVQEAGDTCAYVMWVCEEAMKVREEEDLRGRGVVQKSDAGEEVHGQDGWGVVPVEAGQNIMWMME